MKIKLTIEVDIDECGIDKSVVAKAVAEQFELGDYYFTAFKSETEFLELSPKLVQVTGYKIEG